MKENLKEEIAIFPSSTSWFPVLWHNPILPWLTHNQFGFVQATAASRHSESQSTLPALSVFHDSLITEDCLCVEIFPFGVSDSSIISKQKEPKSEKAHVLIQIVWSRYKNTSPSAFVMSTHTYSKSSGLCSQSGSEFSCNFCTLHSSFHWCQWWCQSEDAAWKDCQPHILAENWKRKKICWNRKKRGYYCGLIVNALFPGPGFVLMAVRN